MTWQPKAQRDAAAVDRAANKCRCPCGGHKCFDCLGLPRWVEITTRIRADNEAEVFPEDLRPRRVT